MRNLFLTTAEAAALIGAGTPLFAAGSAKALAALPKGAWIGGSTPYFMTEAGGLIDHDRVFCTVLDEAEESRTVIVAPDALAGLTLQRYPNGFSYALIPAFSEVHQRFALEANDIPDLYAQPVIGWITGIDLADLGKEKPVVVDGATGLAHENAVAVMHVALKPGYYAEPDIVNLFTPDESVSLTFPATGFSATTCLVNGVETHLAAWLRDNKIETSLPLVSSYAGAVVNVSFQAVHEDKVDFYAPVIAERTYHLAQQVGDYPAAYGVLCQAQGPQSANDAVFSFNCILNYLYAALEGKTTGGFVGPVTFGEVAYILLNQTLVRLDVRPEG
jgi:hypothetical protein